MRPLLHLTLAVATLGTSLGLGVDWTAAQRGATYALRFHRPLTVGTRRRIESDGEKHQTVERRVGRRWEAVETEDRVVSMRAVERVLTVTAGGTALRSELTIESFSVRLGDVTSTPIAAGAVLTLERATAPGGDPVWLSGTTPVAPEIVASLETVTSGSASDSAEDAILAADRPRRVGERWSIAEALAEADLATKTGVHADLRGEVRLVALRTVDALPCAMVTSTISGQVSQMPDLPPGATLANATMTVTFSGALPTDPAASIAPTAEHGLVMEATVTVPGAPNTAPQTIRVRVRQSGRTHATLLP